MRRSIPFEMSKYNCASGFGWTNASYLRGLSFLSLDARRALGKGLSYELYARDAQNA